MNYIKLEVFLTGLIFLFALNIKGQIAINTDGSTAHESSILELKSNNKGLLIPRMSTLEMQNIVNPIDGLIIYNSTVNKFFGYRSSQWQTISTESNGSGSTPWVVAPTDDSTDHVFISSPTVIQFLMGRSTVPSANSIGNSDPFLFFDKNKGSLRGGRLLDQDNWYQDSLGLYSLAYGDDVIASGESSIALGKSTKSEGEYSLSSGFESKALSTYSIALGFQSKSDGINAVSIGDENNAIANNAIAIGSKNQALSLNNLAIGKENIINNTNGGFVIGNNNTVNFGFFGAALGLGLDVTSYTAIGQYNDPNDLENFPKFVVGIGSSDATRKNGLSIYANGNVELSGYTLQSTSGAQGSIMTMGADNLTSWTTFQTDDRITGDGINTALTLPNISTDATITGNGYDIPLQVVPQSTLTDATLTGNGYDTPLHVVPQTVLTDATLTGDGISTPLSVVNASSGNSESITDGDMDTRITVEESSDSDEVLITVEGSDRWKFQNDNLFPLNNNDNLSIGYDAAAQLSNGEENIAIGYETGNALAIGSRNTLIGHQAAKDNNGFDNVVIGHKSAILSNGNSNTAIGSDALAQKMSGSNNVAIGREAGQGITQGDNNVYLGAKAGGSLGQPTTLREGNVFIGYEAGYYEQGNNLLYISNSNTSSPLIKGDFANNTLEINGTLHLDQYSLPSTNGLPGQVLTTQGNVSETAWESIDVALNKTNLGIYGSIIAPSINSENLSFMLGVRNRLDLLTDPDTIFSMSIMNGSFFGGAVEDGIYSTGDHSFRFGYNAKAGGEGAIVLGSLCRSNVNHGVAIGDSAIVAGVGGISIGDRNKVTGLNATSIGYKNASFRQHSTSLGALNDVRAEGASALGLGLKNNNQNSIALGAYNDPISTVVNSTDGPILTIGNGTSDLNRSNALYLDQNSNLNVGGNLAIGIDDLSLNSNCIFKLGTATLTNSASQITINKSILPTAPGMFLGLTGSAWSSVYVDDGYGFSSGAYIDVNAGDIRTNTDFIPSHSSVNLGANNANKAWWNIYSQNAVSVISDRRLKNDIKDLHYSNQDINKLRAVSYKLKSSDETQLGFIAQEVLEVIPEVVNIPDTEDGFYSVNYSELVPLLVKSIQDQNITIEQLLVENKLIREELNKIETIQAEMKALRSQVSLIIDESNKNSK